jgi:RNA polymerase sigma-70 factor (ECF subfamily)
MTAMTIDRQVRAELPWLRRLARRLATEDAEDLVQETWILARRDQPEPRGPGGLRSWLALAMRNRWYSMQRSSLSRGRREALAVASDPEPAPEQRVMEADVIRILDEALGTLSEEDRALLRDRFFEGRSAADISRDLGIPAATVRTRIHRSLARLRGVLDERHGSDRSAWAPAVAAIPLSNTTWKAGLTMATATKGLVVVGALTGLAALGWVLVGDEDRDEVEVSSTEQAGDASGVTATNPSTQETDASDATPASGRQTRQRLEGAQLARARARWKDELAAIEDARKKRKKGPEKGDAVDHKSPQKAELPPPPDLVKQMADLGCLDLVPDHPRGRLALQVHYIGEPDVGTVVESIEVVEDTMDAPELRECWTESMYMLELEPPSEPVEGTYDLAYNAGDGEVVDKLLGLLKQYLREHPGLADQHPALSRCLELPDDAPVNQWMTPEFMQMMGEHPELNQELNEYFTGQLGEPETR